MKNLKSNKTNKKSNLFQSYENIQNKKALRIFEHCFIFPVLLLILKFFGLFQNMTYLFLFIFICLFLVSIIVIRVFLIKKPYSPLIKYILLFSIEIICILISISKGFSVFIIYLLVPLLSCLYLDKKFSTKVTIICYVLMICSIFYRAYLILPSEGFQIKPIKWASSYIVSLSIGYLFNAVIIAVIGKRNGEILRTDYKEIQKNLNSQNIIVSSYVALICKKSDTIEGHLKRSAKYVQIIVEELQLRSEFANVLNSTYSYQVISSSLLHDIGIISIPESILNKETELTQEERELLRQHPVMGEQLLIENMRSVDPEYLAVACDMVLYHHENYDGTGYPYGRQGNEIPLSARIMAVANTLDNLMSDHPYRKGMSFEDSIEVLQDMAGKELDPSLVKAVLLNLDEIKKVTDAV